MLKKIISLLIRKIPRPVLQRLSPVGLKMLGWWYRGNAVECNICQHKYKQFLPYGRMTPRSNALCPNCLSLERHRLMHLFLKERTNFFTAPLRVLHVAPEHCFIRRFEEHKNLDYITADIESPLAKVKMDIHAIPFPDNSFDVAFCNHVMEHVKDDIKAMSELRRVLKPGGWAIIQSPLWPGLATTFEDPSITDPAERERIFGQNDHVRNYGTDYGRRLEQAGFVVDENMFVKQLDASKVALHALPADEIIYYCKK
ncbi:MAG: methyltransferase domain-containing protein [Cytophagaceae bacterium]|jgi:SAM-dependent methyltransferase|nr:methyltransferase domain-containing protein [Cytophagaceae bacterium]